MNNQCKTQIFLSMGKWFVGNSPDLELIAPSLGSCVAICLYEINSKIGGMAHVVFPNRGRNKQDDPSDIPKACYATEVLELLIKEINRINKNKSSQIIAKLAGGAQMFKGIYAPQAFPLIGQNNINILQQKLQEYSIPLKGHDLGGTCSRTAIFDLQDGSLSVRRFGADQYLHL